MVSEELIFLVILIFVGGLVLRDIIKRFKVSKEEIVEDFNINEKEIILKHKNVIFSPIIDGKQWNGSRTSLILTKNHLIIQHFYAIASFRFGKCSYQPIALKDISNVEFVKNKFLKITYNRNSKKRGFLLAVLKEGSITSYENEKTFELVEELKKRYKF